MDLDKCEIGTLASDISSDAELDDQNIVKVLVKDKMKPGMFEEALDFINAYFKKFPQIKDYMNSTISSCRKKGYVSNIFGRRIHLRGINDKNFSVRSFQERAAINAPIQGSAADIIRLAMIEIDKKLNEKINAKMLLQIHDELIFECLKSNESSVKKLIKDTMVNVSSSEHHMFSIPLEVNINSGSNWGEAH